MKPSSKQKSLFIGSIPLNTPESEVIGLFSKFGEVLKTNFKAPKKGRDFFSCILEMPSKEHCLEILDSQPLYIRGSRLSIGFYLYKSEIRRQKYESGKRMVYICNIPIGMTQDQLEVRFRKEGLTVEKCLLNKKGDYESPMENYGFVILSSEAEAKWLLGQEVIGIYFKGKRSKIYLKEFHQKLSIKPGVEDQLNTDQKNQSQRVIEWGGGREALPRIGRRQAAASPSAEGSKNKKGRKAGPRAFGRAPAQLQGTNKSGRKQKQKKEKRRGEGSNQALRQGRDEGGRQGGEKFGKKNFSKDFKQQQKEELRRRAGGMVGSNLDQQNTRPVHRRAKKIANARDMDPVDFPTSSSQKEFNQKSLKGSNRKQAASRQHYPNKHKNFTAGSQKKEQGQRMVGGNPKSGGIQAPGARGHRQGLQHQPEGVRN